MPRTSTLSKQLQFLQAELEFQRDINSRYQEQIHRLEDITLGRAAAATRSVRVTSQASAGTAQTTPAGGKRTRTGTRKAQEGTKSGDGRRKKATEQTSSKASPAQLRNLEKARQARAAKRAQASA